MTEISNPGLFGLHKKTAEKDGLCQRLREQLDALEKETSSKLKEMDSFNNQLKVSPTLAVWYHGGV